MAKAANSGQWDPLASTDWNATHPNPQCVRRIERDLASLYTDPPHGIFVVADEKSVTLLHALVIGPFDTPYEGGFFYFVIKCPPDYPIHSPRVRLMTTGNNTVRFNPNLYKNGKVCLSILGTWSGPAWSPAQSIGCILLSIQSLMNDKPYHNEPGFEKERNAKDVERYNNIIAHETLRVAVVDMITNKTHMPAALYDMAKSSFPQYYDLYLARLEKLKPLHGSAMSDPFGEQRGKFDTKSVEQSLQKLRKEVPFPDDDDVKVVKEVENKDKNANNPTAPKTKKFKTNNGVKP